MTLQVHACIPAVAAIVFAAHGAVLAQAAPLAAGQVSGAELQSWVDADGLALAGISLQNGCNFFAKNKSGERHLTVFCADNMAPWTVKGEGKVVGNQWCIKFRYPNGASDDHCEQFYKVGDNKYEIRLGDKVLNSAYRLVR